MRERQKIRFPLGSAADPARELTVLRSPQTS